MASPTRKDYLCSQVPDPQDSVLEKLLFGTVEAKSKYSHGNLKDVAGCVLVLPPDVPIVARVSLDDGRWYTTALCDCSYQIRRMAR